MAVSALSDWHYTEARFLERGGIVASVICFVVFSSVFSRLNLQRLHKQGITILVFSSAGKINDEHFLNHCLGKCFSKIYTGKWSPSHPHGAVYLELELPAETIACRLGCEVGGVFTIEQ